MRLVLITQDPSLIPNESDILGTYNDFHLLQFTSIQQTMNAYVYFKDQGLAVEPDMTIEAATKADKTDKSDIIVNDTDIPMTDTENPMTTLETLTSATDDADGTNTPIDVSTSDKVIALIDTGVSEDSSNVIDRVSVIGDTASTPANGHGDDMLKAIVSQNPNARILSIRAMDDNGFGTVSSLVAAMEYAINAKVDIINLSLYARTTLSTSVLKQEIQKAIDAGITVIGAAGNDGSDVVDYVPGSVDEAWIIGAANPDGSRYDLSNFGATVDYNVVGESTSVATALFTGYVSLHGVEGVDDVLNQGMIYETDFKTVEEPEVPTEDFSNYTVDKEKIVVTRYTFADKNQLKPDDNLASIYHSDRMLDVLYGTYVSQSEVYDAGDGTYKVKLNAPMLNGISSGEYLDVVFARGNDYGHVITDGVSFDKKTGIATIRKDAMKKGVDDIGNPDFADIQVQVLVPTEDDTVTGTQTVTVENHDGSSYTVKAPVSGFQIQGIPLAITGTEETLTGDDFDVYLNGEENPVPAQLYWDDETHVLSVGGEYAAAVYSVKVVVKKDTDAVFKTAYNGAAQSQNWRNVSPLFYLANGTDATKLKPGTTATVTGKVGVNGYPWMPNDSGTIGTLTPYAKNAGGTLDGDWDTKTGTIGIPTSAFGVNFQFYNSNGTTSKGNWGTGYNHAFWAYCHHTSDSIMSDHQDNYKTLKLKILDQWTANGYTYCAMAVFCDESAFGNSGSYHQTLGGIVTFGFKADSDTWMSAKKVWDDSSNALGYRTSSVKIGLYQKTSTGAYDYTAAPYKSATLNAANNWYVKWSNLPYQRGTTIYYYTIRELEGPVDASGNPTVGAPDGYKVSYTNGNDGTNAAGIAWEAHNANAPTNITATKTWDDYSNKYKTRPESVTVELSQQKNGGAWEVIDTQELNAGNSWKYTWSKLPYQVGSKPDTYAYKVEETTVQYYDPSSKVTGTYEAGNRTYAFTNKVQEGWVSLTKKSANPAMTDNNKCYSLKGAEYTFYLDAACTKSVGKLVTDANGVGINPETGDPILLLTPGEFYYKETKTTDDGHYELDKAGNDGTTPPHKVVVTADNVVTNPVMIGVKDEPGNDPMGITMTKLWTGEKTGTVPSLEGTQFTVLYYDNMSGTAGGCEHTLPKGNLGCTHVKKWVVELKYNANRDAYMAVLDDKYLVTGSDPLYKNNSGNTILPYGTYSIQETKAAPDYTLDGNFTDKNGNVIGSTRDRYFTVVDQNTTGAINLRGGNEYEGLNETVPLSLLIKKYDENNKPLAGVTFHIESESGYPETLPGWVADKTTGADGIVKWEDMYPDNYIITEIKTPEGKNLLKDPIKVSLPGRMTQAEANKYGLKDPDPNDKLDGVVWDESEQVFYINNPVFEVSNDVHFGIPQTGGVADFTTFMPLIGGFGMLGGLGLYGVGRNRKRRRREDEE